MQVMGGINVEKDIEKGKVFKIVNNNAGLPERLKGTVL
jgi:hypothetical protein